MITSEFLKQIFPTYDFRVSFSNTQLTLYIEYVGKPSINKEIEKILTDTEPPVPSYSVVQYEEDWPR